MEGGTLRSGRRSEGHKDILRQRFTEDNRCEFLAMFPLRVYAPTVPRAEVLQGGYDVEGPPAPEYPAANRCDDVRGPVRDDIGLDGERKH